MERPSLRVSVTVGGELADVLERHSEALPEAFIVSQVQLERAEDASPELTIEVEHARGRKCARCWKWTEDDASGSHPDACAACQGVLAELEA